MKSILLLLLGLALPFSAQNTPRKDSFDSFKQVIKLHIVNPDSALSLLDQMENEHLFPAAIINSHRSQVYISNHKYRLAASYGEKALEHELLKQHPKHYLLAVTSCVEAYEKLCEYKKALTLLRKGLCYARKNHMNVADAELTFSIGYIQYLLGNRSEASDKVKQAIRMAQEDPSPRMKLYLSHFYDQLAEFFIREKRYEEALKTNQKQEKNVACFLKNPEFYPFGYYEQECCLLYSKQAYIYALMKQYPQADEAYRNFTKFWEQSTPNSNENIVRYWLETAQYKKIVLYVNNLESPNDTISTTFAKQLALMATVHERLKDYPRAFHYQRRHDLIIDSLYRKTKKDDFVELAAIYQLHEKEHLLAAQDKEIRHNNTLLNLSLGALLITIALLGLVVWKSRTIRQKNTLLSQSLNTDSSKLEDINHLEQQLVTHQQEGAEQEQDRHIYQQLQKLFEEEKLHLNPNLTRQQILDRLDIDNNRFRKLMQEQGNSTLIAYITRLRVKHAIHLLKIHTNYTIQAIAEESGFSNIRSFQRAFKALTKMTPAEYKKALHDGKIKDL